MPTATTSIAFPAILLLCSLLLIYTFSTPSTATVHSNETDRLALLAIKSRLHDPLGVTNSWNNSVPLCLWTGVSCGRRHQRVTELNLSNRSVGGNLSPFIGNLSFLMSIRLEGNNFYGDIPNEVGFLFRLESLILTNNSFSSTIPNNLSHCSKLIKFNANGNKLHGGIPTELGNLLKLESLNIRDNHLTGPLPPSIGNLSALLVIDAAFNSLTGIIPYSLSQLRSLSFFQVGGNNISGMISPIFNISSLRVISLALNRFYGRLPRNICYDLPNMNIFTISHNNFTGHLPYSLSNTSNLKIIDISNNYFSGEVLIDFSHSKNLSFLSLADNNLGTGRATNDLHFLTSLRNCSKLETLFLGGNQFGGVLPKFIGNLSSTMFSLRLQGNQIYGSIPPGIANLVNLATFDISRNQLSGNIPDHIGKLKKLQALYLHENSLQGSIPASLGNLTVLTYLLLLSNNLKGSIPSSLGNCQHLEALDLSKNKLTGILPQQILGIPTQSLGLSVSHNLLTGPFPSNLGSLKTLISIDISGNRFSGEIPSTLGSCTSMEALDMSDNSFNGSIPLSLSSLRSIQYLDLSSNNLSGQIPEYLENLSFLLYLNLSYNHFEGEVPTKGIFRNKTAISLLGNKRLCGGFIELHLPSCPSKKLRKSRIPLLKVVILVIVSCLIVIVACFIVTFTWRRRPAQKSSNMLHTEEQYPMVSYAELSRATGNFSSSNIIGQGRYGLVYKGILEENRMSVAVKVINLQQRGGSKSFLSECEALRNIRHRNHIKIVTICSSIDHKGEEFKALIYEYMENGSLEEWFHKNMNQLEERNLSLFQRLNIAVDVVLALEYLHHHCEPPIVHGDLKPCNVLLDHDMVAHVSDFGLSKFLADRPLISAPETQSSSFGIRGTVGYIAPEYGMGSEMSMPGDVYSFGIFLLEMFIGKRPIDSMFNDGLTLHEYSKKGLPERVMEIVEPSLLLEVRTARRGEGRGTIEECLVGVVRIGVTCSMESPADRMVMADVAAKLSAVRENFLGRRI